MAYRGSAVEEEAARVVRYGPFPRRRAEIVFGLGAAAFLSFGACVELDEGKVAHAVFLAGLVMFAAAMAGHALLRVRFMDLSVWPNRGRLRVVERSLGISWRSRELRVDDVVDVQAEHLRIRTWPQRGRPPMVDAGRLILVTSAGERIPISDHVPGTDVHDRAAAEIRAALQLP